MAVHIGAVAKAKLMPISVEALLERIPKLATSGQEFAVEHILSEVLLFLCARVRSDIGQVNLLARGGRVEKLCIVKDGRPWLKKAVRLHAFDPWSGFTGVLMRSGQTLLVKDIWAEAWEEEPNPFLDLISTMNPTYVEEIKRPVASAMLVPVMRGNEIFATVELSRYRGKPAFGYAEQSFVETFSAQYASLIMEYILDVKVRAASHLAHKKLLNMARLVASNRAVDYKDVVTAYTTLSAADIGFVFIKAGRPEDDSYRMIAWRGEEVREVLLEEFVPSKGSILQDDEESAFPIEGEKGDPKLSGFERRLAGWSLLGSGERDFLLACVREIRSYVVYPLHMLGQDLGALILGSTRARFWPYLYLSPFLSLYTSLLKSFLLNERFSQIVSRTSRKIHNPGFYCLGGLKAQLAGKFPAALHDRDVCTSLQGLTDLFEDLHGQSGRLEWRKKRIVLLNWLRAFVNQSLALYPGLEVSLHWTEPHALQCVILGSDEQLDVLFENLLSNSLRAISYRQSDGVPEPGRVVIRVDPTKEAVRVTFADNGAAYPSISGHGVPQIEAAMRDLGGDFRFERDPYRSHLTFPCEYLQEKEMPDEAQDSVSG